jgi:hypothetical protein
MVYVMQNGQQIGPLDEDALMSLLRAGCIYRDAPCWREGMKEWYPLNEVFNIDSAPRPQPPAPQRATRLPAAFRLMRDGSELGSFTPEEVLWRVRLGDFDGMEWCEHSGEWRQLWQLVDIDRVRAHTPTMPAVQRREDSRLEK